MFGAAGGRARVMRGGRGGGRIPAKPPTHRPVPHVPASAAFPITPNAI